ncbi:MAG: PxKF domain-containing protein, partial [Actinomycetota bacterium]|nr:PxKF domain-containing protein [Actinomycetota bacterium]
MTARRLSSLLTVFAAWLALPAIASAAPGVNGRIVFSGEPDGVLHSELYSVAPDGTGLTRLTWNWRYEQLPTWSRDGTQIAFEAFDDSDRRRIYVTSAHGTGERLVSPASFSSDDAEPSWSPDGTQIAFASTRPFNGSWHVWVVGADGSGLRQVTTELGTAPAWSPDGAEIAYVGPGQAVVAVRPDGTGRREITAPPAGYSDGHPSWSPDGSRLVFTRRPTFGTAAQLYVVDADGSNVRQLTFGSAASFFPSWSPDGTQIVFTQERQLHVIGADGSGMQPLIADFGDALGPDWGTSTVVPSPEVPSAPRILIFSPQPRRYAPGEPIAAGYLCQSDTSFVVSCEGDVPLGAPIETETAGLRTFTVRATDAEGRTSTTTVTFEVLEWRPPTITVRTPKDGAVYELGETVLADYECADDPGGSGIEVCAGDVRPGQPLDTSRTGSFTLRFWTHDRSQNYVETFVEYQVVRRDRTPPAITIDSPREGAEFVLGRAVTVYYWCADEPFGSGLDVCQGDAPAGSALDTGSVGARSFTVTARDRAGNTSSVTRAYRVVYAFSGFSAPLVGFPGTASLDAGDAVPVKFSLGGNHGLGVLAPGSPTWRRVDC